ncbi:shTK domain protein [Ancylostoma ceylanicum]|uniref:ShTK domain protein n=1 Tax=Ancylostoma ceylanicum TaxID=53326 RepID=A0A0D6LK38_9BILA|nr:shTK domain protein [Ancylostoma ceylanicum]
MTAIVAYFVLLAASSTVVTAYLNCGKGAESNCCDKHESCSYWAGINECKKNPNWMLPNCQLSCRSCKTDSVPNKPSTQTSQYCILSCALARKDAEVMLMSGYAIDTLIKKLVA